MINNPAISNHIDNCAVQDIFYLHVSDIDVVFTTRNGTDSFPMFNLPHLLACWPIIVIIIVMTMTLPTVLLIAFLTSASLVPISLRVVCEVWSTEVCEVLLTKNLREKPAKIRLGKVLENLE
jgi:hypothetical protein